MAKKIKILVAEDEHAISNSLRLMLEDSGFDVVIAENGRKALDNLEKESFDIMLLDLMMPEVDGFGVLEEMKEKNITTPVIISSNLSQEEDIKRVKEFSFVKDYFVKSDTSLIEVVKNIKKVLNN